MGTKDAGDYKLRNVLGFGSTGFGATATTQSLGFGTGTSSFGFGSQPSNTATVRPLG